MDPIDAVITWVDGEDPAHRAKREKYGSSQLLGAEDAGGSTRFSSLGEIGYCVASLNRFAPWLRKIYIVTDEQDPHLEAFLSEQFPQGFIPMEIVDHKVIFRDYEQYLPSFNSVAIESLTWRIPGLSERYIELNDDFVVTAPVQPADFFTSSGASVCYAVRYSMGWTKWTRLLKRKNEGRRQVTFKGCMYNAALLVGRRGFFLKFNHTPRALQKEVYRHYFAAHPEALEHNLQFRFRDASQYNPQELQFLLLQREGRLVVRPVRGVLFFLQPKNRAGYVARKMARLQKGGAYKFCCFNSLDKASTEERQQIVDWLKHRLQLR